MTTASSLTRRGTAAWWNSCRQYPPNHYTLRATIRPNWLQNGKLVFGLACKSSTFWTREGFQNSFHALLISTPENQPASALLEQRWFGQGSGPKNTVARSVHSNRNRTKSLVTFDPLIETAGVEWNLTLSVTPQNVSGTCTRPGETDPGHLEPITSLDQTDFLGQMSRVYPDTQPYQQQALTGSGIGIFVGSGSCTLLRFRIELDEIR